MFQQVFLLFFCLLNSFLSVKGTSQFTDCPSSVCLSLPVSYECSVNITGTGADSLRWEVLDTGNNPVGNPITYDKNQQLGRVDSIGSDFTTNITVSAGPIVSDISFTPTLSISEYTVECQARGNGLFTPVTCPITIPGIPAAPVPNDIVFVASIPHFLTFSWSSTSNSTCFSHYSVNVTSIDYTINTTDTNLSLTIRPMNSTEYSISVVAVDTGGRSMEPQRVIPFIPGIPQNVTNLMLEQTYPNDDDIDTDTTVNITLSWSKPPSSSRPPVLNYIIYHNVTDIDTDITIPVPTTTFTITDATIGSVYTVEVAASNVLGTGSNASAIISIASTIFVTPSPTMTPSSTLESTVTPSTSSSTMGTTTSSTTPSPTTGTGTGGLPSTAYIGIGVGVPVIIIVVILIVFGCLIYHKPWKGEGVIFNQSKRDSTEPIALVNKEPAPETGQAIYQEPDTIKREAAPTGDLYAQPDKPRRNAPSKPEESSKELPTYQDPNTIQRTQAPAMDYMYAEVDKKKEQQMYAQVDKERKGGDGTVYADLALSNTGGQAGYPGASSAVIYSDVNPK